MIIKALVGMCAVLGTLLVLQTWRLGNCQQKAKLLDTCQEVDQLEREIHDADDDTLLDDLLGR